METSTRGARGDRMPPLRLIVVVTAGALFLLSILWSFFPTLLGLSPPAIDDPWRLGIPSAVAFGAGLAVGSLVPAQPVRTALLTISPGVAIGSLLGLFAALEPYHLLIVAALAVSAVGLAMLGGLIGGRVAAAQAS